MPLWIAYTTRWAMYWIVRFRVRGSRREASRGPSSLPTSSRPMPRLGPPS